jgi:hypothetical protein
VREEAPASRGRVRQNGGRPADLAHQGKLRIHWVFSPNTNAELRKSGQTAEAQIVDYQGLCSYCDEKLGAAMGPLGGTVTCRSKNWLF